MNYTFTSRPVSTLWFSARYRQYDFDNRTVPFQTANSVNYDTAIVALNQSSEPFGSIRHTFDADATYSPVRHLGFRAGYTREDIDRTYRIVEKTTEDIGRASVDLTGLGWMTVRGVYEHSKRTGSPVDQLELLSIGEQPTLRQFDISDRNQDRFSTILTVIPVSQFSVNGTAGVGSQEYPGTNFGLRSSDSHFYSVGVRLHAVRQDLARRDLRLREIHRAAGVEKREPAAGQRPDLAARPDAAVQRSAPRLDRQQRRQRPHHQRVDGSAQAVAAAGYQDGVRLYADRVDLHLRAGAGHRAADAGAAHAGDQRAAARDAGWHATS